MRFTHAIVCPPAPNFAEGLTTVDLGVPDYERALVAHEQYCQALRECGVFVEYLEADPRYPDSTFVEDTAILTSNMAIFTNPGAESRQGEVEAVADALTTYYRSGDRIDFPGTLDGGDVCEAGWHYFIGISARTNEEGAVQLSQILERLGYQCDCIDIRSTPGILHLKSGIAYIGDNRMVVIDVLAGHPALANYELIRVEPEEAYAANCVRVNDKLLFPAGFPRLAARLRELGYTLIELDMTEFQKMDGGLSCLSLRF